MCLDGRGPSVEFGPAGPRFSAFNFLGFDVLLATRRAERCGHALDVEGTRNTRGDAQKFRL